MCSIYGRIEQINTDTDWLDLGTEPDGCFARKGRAIQPALEKIGKRPVDGKIRNQHENSNWS